MAAMDSTTTTARGTMIGSWRPLMLTEISSPENELRYIVRTEKRALLTVSLAEKGWGVRLYTEEYGRAEWHRELTVSCAGEVILSFQPYVYGERED